jgi:hypothetical protein
LVSSAEKEWLTISPYAVKFWDKLNLEPYSKQKNISYIVLIPDFESEIFDNFNFTNNNTSTSNQNNEETDYLNYFIKNTTSTAYNNHNNSSTESNRKSINSTISNSINEINNAIKEYFKELTSTYELCRLGVHRPALRIAPDNGFVKVPLLLSNKNNSNSKNANAKQSSNNQKRRSNIQKNNSEGNLTQ